MTIARLAMVALTLGAVGCAGNSGPQYGAAAQKDAQGIQLRVENTTTSSLRVYALVRGAEMPLGRVEALGERTVRLPQGIGGSVRLVARPSVITSDQRRHVSEPIGLMEGGRITWTLQTSPGVSNVPHMSIVRVFSCSREPDC